MSIKHLEAHLARLTARIAACQAELADLKAQRRDVKSHLVGVKRALREGRAPPAGAEYEGLAERLGSAFTENVIEPIVELLHPAPEKP
jgi:hypothetical protein